MSERGRLDKALIFDIGGVIILFDHMSISYGLSEFTSYSPADIHKSIFTDGLEGLYDEGMISTKDFYKKVKELLKTNITFHEFSRVWNKYFEEDRGVSQLIRELKEKGYNIYLLSNTNELHYRCIEKRYSILREIKDNILSFEIGCRKPGIRIFEAVMDKSGLPAEKHIYIDDKQEFVNIAKSIGMEGILFKSVRQLREGLQEHEILLTT